MVQIKGQLHIYSSTSYNLQQQLKKVTEESTVHVATFKK